MLQQFPGFQTNDINIIRAMLSSEFSARRFECLATDENTFIKANWARTSRLQVICGYSNVRTDADYDGAPVVRQMFELRHVGRMKYEAGGKVTELSELKTSFIVPADVPFRAQTLKPHSVLSIRFEKQALNRTLSALLNDDVTRDIEFDHQDQQDQEHQHKMKQAALQFVSDFNLMGPELPSFAYEEFAQVLIMKFLLYNSNSFSAMLNKVPAAPSFVQLRRVEDFIEANWFRAIEVDELARLFDISARSIFRHFKTYRGETPLQYLKRVRLEQARELLQTDSNGSGVMAIALKCGFQSLGHFARDYRQKYGELPNQTLRRSRG